jgi:hypothetical protein
MERGGDGEPSESSVKSMSTSLERLAAVFSAGREGEMLREFMVKSMSTVESLETDGVTRDGRRMVKRELDAVLVERIAG